MVLPPPPRTFELGFIVVPVLVAVRTVNVEKLGPHVAVLVAPGETVESPFVRYLLDSFVDAHTVARAGGLHWSPSIG
jgi:hypothetical protein